MRNAKRIIIVSTMAFTIAISCIWSGDANASAPADSYKRSEGLPQQAGGSAQQDEWLDALGADSDEDVYEALYDGKSLADIAAVNGSDVREVIDLQVAQLANQLDERLAAGSLSPEAYLAQLAELREIVTGSAYGGAASRMA